MNDRQVACLLAAIVYASYPKSLKVKDRAQVAVAAKTAMDLLEAVFKAWDADPRVGLPDFGN